MPTATWNTLFVPAAMIPPAARVSAIRQGVIAVYFDSVLVSIGRTTLGWLTAWPVSGWFLPDPAAQATDAVATSTTAAPDATVNFVLNLIE
jgi:hypothetical protein